jgi:hypothetical protein
MSGPVRLNVDQRGGPAPGKDPMQRRGMLLGTCLLLFSLTAGGRAQDETPSCAADDLYYLGLGTGQDGGIAFRTQFHLRNLSGGELETRLLLFRASGESWPTSSLNAQWPDTEGSVVEDGGSAVVTLPSRATAILTLESRQSGRLGWSCLAPRPDLLSRVELQVAQFPESVPASCRHRL